jgi:hypothetical protein
MLELNEPDSRVAHKQSRAGPVQQHFHICVESITWHAYKSLGVKMNSMVMWVSLCSPGVGTSESQSKKELGIPSPQL